MGPRDCRELQHDNNLATRELGRPFEDQAGCGSGGERSQAASARSAEAAIRVSDVRSPAERRLTPVRNGFEDLVSRYAIRGSSPNLRARCEMLLDRGGLVHEPGNQPEDRIERKMDACRKLNKIRMEQMRAQVETYKMRSKRGGFGRVYGYSIGSRSMQHPRIRAWHLTWALWLCWTGVAGAQAGGGTWTDENPLQFRRLAYATVVVGNEIYLISGVAIGVPPGHVEVYQPGVGSRSAAPLPTPRTYLGAALGPDGRIYAIGGYGQSVADGAVEAYDPSTDSWTTLASLPTPRADLGVVTAPGPDGSPWIYAIGGREASNQKSNKVEAYNPSSAIWVARSPLPEPREGLQVAFANGHIYAMGGINTGAASTTVRVDAYDPATDTWTTVSDMPNAHYDGAAASDTDGRIYVMGTFGGDLKAVDVYVPELDKWCTCASMSTPRTSLGAAGLGGKIYALGGSNAEGALNSVEALTPAPDRIRAVAPMPTPRSGLAAFTATGSDGVTRIYALGGHDAGGTAVNTLEAYDPITDQWTTLTGMPTARASLTATVGSDGRVYAIGGNNESGVRAGIEAYDPASDTWTSVGPVLFRCMEFDPPGRSGHASALGPDGRIYSMGGFCPQITMADGTGSVEAYQPGAGSSFVADVPHAGVGRYSLAAATATPADGLARVYALGGALRDALGTELTNNLVSAYDWTRDAWESKTPMSKPRQQLAAATGSDGKIYVVGGLGDQSAHYPFQNEVDAYDPLTDSWQTVGCIVPRYGLAAAVGPDGAIYVIGGIGVRGAVTNMVEAYQP